MALRVSKISKIFQSFKKINLLKKKSFVISLSGGSDSLALAALAKPTAMKKYHLLRFN